jgi:Ca-activated chloride channel family protein
MKTATETHNAVLTSASGKAIPLQRVEISARVDDLLFTITTRQHYRNPTKKNIETLYTFPLAWGCSLLTLRATVAGKTWQGTVLPKEQAEQDYERAIASGDTPIMVEKSGDGLYTAQLGNLKAGEEAIIEITYAQLLRVEHGQVRLSIPTTVAPRYGDAKKVGKLKQPASVDVAEDVVYPLSIQLEVAGSMGKLPIHCPSHTMHVQANDDVTTLSLFGEAFLDRDVVLLIDEVPQQQVATLTQDGEEFPALLSITPSLSADAAASACEIQLKVLVDCSGSMGGESMALAKKGLMALMPLLSSADVVSFSRFGNHPKRVIGRMTAATPEFKASSLREAIEGTDADMGGTEMNSALVDTFNIKTERSERPINVLVITDGEIWDIESTIQLARESNHRVFAIGVGSSPAESLLRDIAAFSDGACELVSPNEDMAAAMQRMVMRMRQGVVADLAVDWHAPVLWQAPAPKVLYPGETIHLAAVLASQPATQPKVTGNGLASLGVGIGDMGTITAEGWSVSEAPTLARMVGARRLRDAGSAEVATELALRYQLVTEHTNLLLIAEREDGDKAKGLPQPHQVPQMLAAGWHNRKPLTAVSMSRSRVLYSMQRSAHDVSLASFISSTPEKPRYLRRQAIPDMLGTEPGALLQILSDVALQTNDLTDALTRLMNCGLPSEIEQVIQRLSDQLQDRVLAWGVFLDWLVSALQVEPDTSRHAKRLLSASLQGLDDDVRDQIRSVLKNMLPDVTEGSWGTVGEDDDVFDVELLIARQHI